MSNIKKKTKMGLFPPQDPFTIQTEAFDRRFSISSTEVFAIIWWCLEQSLWTDLFEGIAIHSLGEC